MPPTSRQSRRVGRTRLPLSRRTAACVAVVIATLVGSACVAAPTPVVVPPPPSYPPPPSDPVRPPGAPSASPRPVAIEWCAGIRGNGTRFFSHFGTLARMSESYGPPSCVAGGSSGSITSFLVESIWAGGHVTECTAGPCSDSERNARAALLYKSVTDLFDVGIVADLFFVLGVIQQFAAEPVQVLGNRPLLAAYETASANVQRDLADVIDPELRALLASSPFAALQLADVVGALGSALNFELESSLVFIRPGLVNFGAIADILGRAASFYAGYGTYADPAAMDAWLSDCAVATVGDTWQETAALATPDGTCGARFREMYAVYRSAVQSAPTVTTRLDDPVGRYLPVLATTAVLTGDAVAQWYEARADYDAYRTVEFTPDFADVRFGYWGNEADLATVQEGLESQFPGDPVTERFLPLGAQPWREVMLSSPAEPGFAAARRLAQGALGVGGWSDPLRVQVVKSLGANRVVAVTKQGGVGTFERNAAIVLGASPIQVDDLFSLEAPSSFGRALAEAEGVWCSNWDAPDMLDDAGLFADGYDGTFITSDPSFTGAGAAPNVDSAAQIGGCTPGLAIAYPE